MNQPVKALWKMQNGYALCTRAGLDAIAEHLDALQPEQLDILRGKLFIGVHRDVEVTDVRERMKKGSLSALASRPANKLPGIRAVMALTPTIARYSREHNGANVLTLGASLLTEAEALEIVSVWLATPMREPRYIRRLTKIRDLERGLSR